jgi:NAD(P)-dependent dehydrogenase (short-subunit alcohol dehydrogenase family)
VAVNYVSNAERAKQVAETVEKHGRTSFVIQGDVGVLADCKKMVAEATKALGGLDIIIANAGWTKPTAFGDLDALTEDEWDKCWAVNTKSNMHLLREALPTFNQNADGGCFIATSSIAGVIAGGSSMGYSVAKAAGLHLLLCLAETQGPKVRVNAILPGWMPTEWACLHHLFN